MNVLNCRNTIHEPDSEILKKLGDPRSVCMLEGPGHKVEFEGQVYIPAFDPNKHGWYWKKTLKKLTNP